MKKITDILKNKDFTISVEIVPPRNGENLHQIYHELDELKNQIDYVSVTKGAGGSLRGGTLPIAYFAQVKSKINAIAHYVCRERTKQEIENGLTDLSYFGIKNILALRGDPPAGTNEEWDGDYKYAYLLCQQIKNMNNGIYLPTPTMKEEERKGNPTDFCIIVAGHPQDKPEDEIKHMKCKVGAGAEVIITQMIFSFEEYDNYVKMLRKNGIDLPVIAGIRPLTAISLAESTEKFFGMKIAEELKNGLRENDNPREFGLNYFADMIRKLKESGCPGVHLFVLNDLKLVDDLLSRI